MIEALVALFVFATAGVGLVQLQAYSLSAFSRVETRALASIVAQNQLVDVVSAAHAPDLGTREGEIEMAGRRWRWRLVVSPTADPGMRRAAVDVSDLNNRAPRFESHAFIATGDAVR